MRETQGGDSNRQPGIAGPTSSRIQVRIIIVLVFAVLAAAPAQADQWSLLINGKAVHLDDTDDDFNDDGNWGAGVQYDFDITPGQWVPFINVSGFRDSNGNPSYYIGGGTARRFFLGKDDGSLHLDAGAVAFLMTRKDYNNGNPFPAVLPMVSFGTDRIALNVTYAPEVGPIDVAVLFFQLKIGLIGVK